MATALRRPGRFGLCGNPSAAEAVGDPARHPAVGGFRPVAYRSRYFRPHNPGWRSSASRAPASGEAGPATSLRASPVARTRLLRLTRLPSPRRCSQLARANTNGLLRRQKALGGGNCVRGPVLRGPSTRRRRSAIRRMAIVQVPVAIRCLAQCLCESCTTSRMHMVQLLRLMLLGWSYTERRNTGQHAEPESTCVSGGPRRAFV